MTMNQTLLDITGVAKSFGSVTALKSAAIRVGAGEVHALMGANGAGKSTLVKIMTGVFAADAGTIALNGQPCRFRSPAEARAAGIVSVYQDPALVPDLTVAQNLRLAEVEAAKVSVWLEQLGIGGLDLRSQVRDLPYPILRLIDLARALASDPKLLLLDEMTAALSTDLADNVFRIVRARRAAGQSVLFISHRMAEVAAICDRATVLRDGVTVGVTDMSAGSDERIVTMMLGTDIARAIPGAAAAARPPAAPAAPPALEVRGLRKGHLLEDVSFTLNPGEVLGVVALEGQGQEELFDCIAGVRRPDGGSIHAGGRQLALRHPADAIAAGLVLVPANRLHALLPQRSIRENVALATVRRLASWGPIGMAAEKVRVEDAVRRLQIDTRAESELKRLSGGNQQKVVIARWIASGFKTLLCFDPTRGIDIGTKRQIYALVRDVAATGASVLLFTSELAEIPLACDRVVVLYQGRVVQELDARTADEEVLLRAAHGLSSDDRAHDDRVPA